MPSMTWAGSGVLKLKIVARPGEYAILPAVFAVGVLGAHIPLFGNGALVDTVVATGSTNTVIGLERAVVLESAAATGEPGAVTA